MPHLFRFTLAFLLFLPLLSFGQSGVNNTPTERLIPEESKIVLWDNDLQPIESEVAKAIKNKDLKEGDIFRLDRLFFEADRSEIQVQSFGVLDEIVLAIQQRADISLLEIGGFTNGLPPDVYCNQLSEARAKQVYDYFVKNNIDPDRLAFKGYGKRFPVAKDDTLEGRQQNQRVEIKIVKLD